MQSISAIAWNGMYGGKFEQLSKSSSLTGNYSSPTPLSLNQRKVSNDPLRTFWRKILLWTMW